MIENKFKTAQEAFEYFYPVIQSQGEDFSGTKALFNVGFTIEKPMDRIIDTTYLQHQPLVIYSVEYLRYGKI